MACSGSQTSAVKAEALLDAHPEIFWSQHFQHGRDDLRAMHSKPDGPLSPSGDLEHAARAQLPSLLLHVNSKLVLETCGCGDDAAEQIEVRAARGVTAAHC